ncbi:MAG: PEGA domain-containing protein, partial [Bryobacteraceae bacterium]
GVLVAAGAGFFAWQGFFSTPDAGTAAELVSQPPAAQPQAAPPPPVADAPRSEPVKTPEPASPPAAAKTDTPAASAKAAPAPKEAAVEITTTPPGATVVFDRDPNKTCTSPCSISLETGRHVYTATLAGYRAATRIMEVPKESGQSLTLEQQSGAVMVSTTPAGATIVVNGRPHSQKTPAILTLPAGRHKIELSLAGHPNYEEVVEVRDAVSRHLSVDFTGR